MKHLVVASVVAASLGAVGCATHGHAEHGAAAQTATAALEGPASRTVEFPGAVGEGEAREVRVLVDTPALKLVSITLRNGTVLPTHSSTVPVTIQALQGAGTVVVGAERMRLDGTHAVVLAPGVAHAVEPDAGTHLVVLVHHLGRGAEHHHH